MSPEANRTRAESDVLKVVLKIDPIAGTRLGIEGDHDGKLPPTDESFREELLKNLERTSAFLIQSSSAENVDDYVDGQLAANGCRSMQILNSALRPHEQSPDWYVESAMSSLYSLLMRADMHVEEKSERIRERIASIPAHLNAGKLQINRPPSVLVETATGNIPGAIAFCQDSLGDFIASLSSRAAQEELNRHRRACVDALQDFGDYVTSLESGSSDEFAIGKKAFDQLLASYLVHDGSDELFERGKNIVRDLEKELEKASLKIADRPEWWLTLEALAANRPTRDSLLPEYEKMVEDARQFIEERKLVDLPLSGDLDILPTPSFARTNLAFAAYVAVPPLAKTGRAQFWVTPIAKDLSDTQAEDALKQHHLGRILIASVHEAYPGHHVQFSHALKVARPLRHVFGSTVFFEGWGLYSEELMLREGFKNESPNFELLRMSQVRDQLWRALRVVLDVGLHCKAMSRAEATDLLVTKHVLDRKSAAAEVMYYCSAPTQPMSYMVGKLLIDQLIEKCKATGQQRFRSLSQIHNQLLAHGGLPFPLLERVLRLAG
jgi:hypothetical protein